MASTNPITYIYDYDGHTIEVSRRHVRTAFASNGNVSNPTEYFVWQSTVDGEYAAGLCVSRADAYEHARAKIQGVRFHPGDDRGLGSVGVRSYIVVRNEMQANYRSRRAQ